MVASLRRQSETDREPSSSLQTIPGNKESLDEQQDPENRSLSPLPSISDGDVIQDISDETYWQGLETEKSLNSNLVPGGVILKAHNLVKTPSMSPTPPFENDTSRYFTESDRVFFFNYLAWALKKNRHITKNELYDQLSRKACLLCSSPSFAVVNLRRITISY
jgi:hypothetical protein